LNEQDFPSKETNQDEAINFSSSVLARAFALYREYLPEAIVIVANEDSMYEPATSHYLSLKQ